MVGKKTSTNKTVLCFVVLSAHILLGFEQVGSQTSTPQPDVEQPSLPEDPLPAEGEETKAPMVPAGQPTGILPRPVPASEDPAPATEVPTNLVAPPNSEQNASDEGAQPPDEPPSPLGSTTEGSTPLETISDRGAASLDPTAIGLGSGFSTIGLPTIRKGPFFQAGPLALSAVLNASVIAEKESRDSTRTDSWKFGSQLAGSLGATLGYPLTGQYLDARYAGSYQLGGRSRSDGNFEQALSLTGNYHFAQLRVALTGDYAHTTGPDRDVGSSVNRDTTAFRLTALYPLSVRSSADLTLAESSKQYGGGIDSNELSAALFLNRVLSVKTRIGLGGTFGALLVEGENDQPFEQVNLRVTYVAAVKLSLAATLGYEWRQTGTSSSATPVFNGNVSYALRPTTNLSLAANRSVSNSAVRNRTNYVSSSVRAVISQRIGSRASASLSLGYQNADYDSAGNQQAIAREDNLIFARPSIRWHLSESLSVSLFYSFSENFSNTRSFESQQVNLGVSYTF